MKCFFQLLHAGQDTHFVCCLLTYLLLRAAHLHAIGWLSNPTGSGWSALATRSHMLQVSEPLLAQVHDCFHLKDTLGSDHCPLGLVLKTQAETKAG